MLTNENIRLDNAEWVHAQLIATLCNSVQPVFFSLLVDESNDRGVESKDLVILVRFFDFTMMRAITHFIDLPTANNGSAAAILDKIDYFVRSQSIKYENLLCVEEYVCDTGTG